MRDKKNSILSVQPPHMPRQLLNSFFCGFQPLFTTIIAAVAAFASCTASAWDRLIAADVAATSLAAVANCKLTVDTSGELRTPKCNSWRAELETPEESRGVKNCARNCEKVLSNWRVWHVLNVTSCAGDTRAAHWQAGQGRLRRDHLNAGNDTL